MADKKISQLTANTGPLNADLLALVDSANNTTKKVTMSTVKTYVGATDGWVSVEETWTYASATTITVPTDATTRYNKGDMIRLKQGGSYKYFYIVSVAATVLTITGGTDYTLANSAITNMYVSRAENPLDFPDWFAYTPTLNGSGGSIGTFTASPYLGKFKIVGKQCFFRIKIKCTNVGSWSGTVQVALPVTNNNDLSEQAISGFVAANAANPVTAGRGYPVINNASVIQFLTAVDTGSLTWGTFVVNDHIRVQGFYQI